MPLPAIILICVGCALGLAGLVILGIRIVGLLRAARAAGIKNMADVQEVVARVQRLEPRFIELERHQAAVAESLQRVSAEVEVLTYFKDELDEATGHARSRKS